MLEVGSWTGSRCKWRGDLVHGLWAEAIEAIQKYGAMIKSPQGSPIRSPYRAIANRQAEVMLRIASEFGFTPASRGRISALIEEERDPVDLLGQSGRDDVVTWPIRSCVKAACSASRSDH